MKTILVNEWMIVEQVTPGKKHPSFSVIIADSSISTKAIQVRLPYSSVADTTITPETHDLFIVSEKLKINTTKLNKNSVFFREKTDIEEGGTIDESSFSNTPISSTFGTKISRKRKTIIDPNSGSNVTVGEDGSAIGSPGKEVISGKNGTMLMAGSPIVPSFPEQDGILIKENGLSALMPRCFVPPFCMPRFLPNLQFMAQIAGVIGLMKAISEIRKEK